MRDLIANDIDVDDVPEERELYAARVMRRLLRRYSPLEAIVIALQWRGKSRVLRVKDALQFLLLIQRYGGDYAWRVAVSLGYFLHRDLPTLPMMAFDLNAMSDTDCRKSFRFDHAGIKRLVILLRVPNVLITPEHGDRFSATEAVCLLLERLSYPRTLEDLQARYDRFKSALCRMTIYMIHHILKAAKKQILFSRTTTAERLRNYVQAFKRRGVPDELRVWSIIDVKKVANCRPTHDQQAQFSGHKKYHCFKYQTLEAPDDGRRGDGYILRASNLLPFLDGHDVIRRNEYLVFPDSAYPNNNIMMTMFRGRNLTPWATAFNKRMAKVRVSVEWGYAQVTQNFAFLDWERQLRIEAMPVEAFWLMAVFFTNCLTCHWGRNQSSDYFSCSPPTLEEYLSGVHFQAD
ncbi:DDE superfamily endonuclease [Phytophthora infestans]|uniref:DDE superfamily endonuclease n=1 Tax=Phytophthora infestans TaxID=4787 RepID=A0A833SWP0_PHYIN|nr:DDE superfamily endonuclease [Phytophthora infestans]